ncbi:recombinase RecT, partial [Lactococcus garvieae]|uniref:recombinase RecT n=1 Tax=Lactococcus garvieae TaxID=1363 RepID=UPI0022E79521
MANEIKNFMKEDAVMKSLTETLGRNAQSFVTSALSAVGSNNQLKDATPESVYKSVMKAATLNLPVDPNLGFTYLVPYKRNFKDGNWSYTIKVDRKLCVIICLLR